MTDDPCFRSQGLSLLLCCTAPFFGRRRCDLLEGREQQPETSAQIKPKNHHGTLQHPVTGRAVPHFNQDWHFLGRTPRHRGAVQSIPPAKLKPSSCCVQQTTCHCCLQPWPAQRQVGAWSEQEQSSLQG